MDASAVRADIKTWEREFRSTHGRDPSVQEIKARPDIAEKYKLYKKLSKKANTSSVASTSADSLREDRHQTPPRSSHRPRTTSLLFSSSKHRAIKTEAPSLTSNPFSPVKNKGKDRRYDTDDTHPSADSDFSTISLLLSSNSRNKSNPFATPSKPKPRASSSRKIPPPVLEEDPFPLIDSHTLASSSHRRPPQQPQVPDVDENRSNVDDRLSPSGPLTTKPVEDAVTRARKRLRGEHVSPSPVKEKRPKTDSEPIGPNRFTRGSLFEALQAAREEESEEEPGRRGSDEEFIGETPVKPMKGGKAFVKLFNEALPSSSFSQSRPKSFKPPARTKSAGSSLFAFGFGSQGPNKSNGKQRASSPEDDMDVDYDDSRPLAQTRKLKALNFTSNGIDGKSLTSAAKSNRPLAKVVVPTRSDFFDDASSTASMTERVRKIAIKKRPLTIDEGEIPEDDKPQSYRQPTSSPPPLLPPSPPPTSTSGSKYSGDKGKTSLKGLARKKTKLFEQNMAADNPGGETDVMSDDSDEVKLKEISWSWNAHLLKNRQDGTEDVPGVDDNSLADSEPEFGMTKYRPTPLSSPDGEVEGKFEVDLPEHLRQVLAISTLRPELRMTLDDGERLARGLIYGRREGHYDPARGGEIWGVGELEEEDKKDVFNLGHRKMSRAKIKEEDDDWEGEPVSWEVGEL
ncbi:DNA replication and checkpoint protein-domain-containing protein [Irpex rosettiformis]|uniref:DNA replication and checkpoint protein-domain-containing protein n=1 Tax=Irpex rosettiformis TaxID=378272 RepID=A0ACB8UKZ0_9APHY|nr:DNA replication and checkpoint protein-domain-containing protein [Irpex rosettiformis]